MTGRVCLPVARTRRLAATLAAVAACCVMSGCVSIPQSSLVSPGRSAGVQDEPQHVTNDPAGPAPGASPLDIAQGFFSAMLAFPQTMTTAREYLTPSAAAHWVPTHHVQVYDTLSPAPNHAGVMMRAHVLGRLNARGVWASTLPGRSQQGLQVRLLRVKGEWRIANPPPGLYVDSDYFDSNYGEFSLYFFDPSREVLTADPVYLVDDDTAATALVTDLIEGPTPELRGAVLTAVPGETKISVAVSTLPSGVAEVPLSDDFLKLSDDDRQFFAAQLAWTLRQLPDVHSISITVDGTQVQIPGFKSVFSVDEFLGYDPAGLTGERRLFALSPNGLVAVTTDGLTPVLEDPKVAQGARSVAIDEKGALAALVSSDGTTVGVDAITAGSDAGGTNWIRGVTSLLRPSWDFRGVLWEVGTTPVSGTSKGRTPTGSTIYTATADRQQVVRAPGLTGTDIVSFGVSRDGVRFAAIVRDKTSTRLVIAVIRRDPDHPERVTLTRPRTVRTSAVSLSDLSHLAWVSPTAVVVLARSNNGARQPWQVAIDGSSAIDVGEFLHVQPVSIAAGANLAAPIAIGSASGQILVQQSDLQWLQIGAATRLRMPVYAG